MEKGQSRPTILAGCLTSSSDSSLSVHPGESRSSRWLKSSRTMRYRFQPSTWGTDGNHLFALVLLPRWASEIDADDGLDAAHYFSW
jgi:hypothetical protein